MVGVLDPVADRATAVTLERLDDQISWYNGKSAINRRWHYRLKVATLISAGVIPVTAAVGSPSYVAGTLGVFVVIVEGLQQLFQFHQNWVNYRGTCESAEAREVPVPCPGRRLRERRSPAASARGTDRRTSVD